MRKILQKLDLNPNNSIVIGSGILQALKIRKSKDIDLVVTQKIYDSLKDSGKFTVLRNHGREVLTNDIFEIGTSWRVLGKPYRFEDFANDSTVIDGVRYITLGFLYRAKKSWLSQKDIDDVELIEEYLKQKDKIKVLKLRSGQIVMPVTPFEFDSTFHKPDHFTTGDNYWNKGTRWQTWAWEGKCLGLRFKNLGTRQKPKIEVTIYSDEKLDKDFVDSLIEEIKYRYNLDLDLTAFYKKFKDDKVLGGPVPLKMHTVSNKIYRYCAIISPIWA